LSLRFADGAVFIGGISESWIAIGLIIGAYLSSALFGFANTIIDYRRIMG